MDTVDIFPGTMPCTVSPSMATDSNYLLPVVGLSGDGLFDWLLISKWLIAG